MSKRFIRAAAVLFLLLLVEAGAGQNFKYGTAEEYGENDSDNTVLFRYGLLGIDAWMNFTNGTITEDGCFADIPQCIWGKWVVTEKWINAIYGWDANVEDEWIGTSIELHPSSFGFGDQSDETSKVYYAHVMAVKDPWDWYEEIGIYWELGISGDYYFVFQYDSGQKMGIFTNIFMLGSENEIVIPVNRYEAYKLVKTESYTAEEEDGGFERDQYCCYDICYGVWKAVKAVRTDGTLDLATCLETFLVLREDKDMDLSWRVLGRSNETVDRFARLMGVGENNEYLICYNLPEDCFWDQMILIDDMAAILVKGDNLFWARRISNPAEDHIYWTLP